MTAISTPGTDRTTSLRRRPFEPAPRGRRLLAWHVGAVSVVWLSALFVVWLWVVGGGVQGVAGLDTDSLTGLGRLTGLVAADLLLLQVLLMARIPLFENGFGRDAVTRLHRTTGFWSFWLMLAHIALLVAGYATAAGTGPLTQLWDLVWDYPGMLLATAGTALLVLVVVTSVRRARRRLRRESWHLLHLYAYLGVGLAIPHMLWTGADFLASPMATAYWWTLWATAAAAVVVFRVIVPLARSIRHGLRVVSVAPDGAHGVAVRVRGRRVRALRARAGQFLVWRFLDGPGWSRGHPFSLASAPSGDDLVLSARVVGDGTRRLAALRPGTRVLVEGPYGHLTGERRHGRKLLMLGAGAGVAPLVSLLESEPYAPGEATLLTRDHDPRDAMRADAIARLVSRRGLRHVPLDGPRAASGPTWLPATHGGWDGAELVRHLAPDLDAYDVYLCGPGPWMAALRRDLRRAGVRADRVHAESFDL